MGVPSRPVAAVAAVLLASAATAQDRWPTDKWPTAPPKAVGLDPAALAGFDAALTRGDYGHVDSVTVIRRGRVAFDKTYPRDYDRIYGALAKTSNPIIVHDRTGPYNYFAPWWHPYYRRGDLHTLQSITKTVVSAVVGVAVARNEFPALDTPVMTFFDESKVANLDDRKRRMTIRQLLTMTSGLKWNYTPNPIAAAAEDTDLQFEASYDWVKFAIDRPMAADPGATFNYASGAVQILAHIFNTAVGTDIEEYAARHLFAPLGIEHFYWKRTPAGVVDASGGLYLRPHDLAKIGHLYLHNGTWDGKRVVTAEWVKESVTGHVETPAMFKGSKWGYLWGTLPYGEKGRHTVFGTTGFGGQGLLVFPDHDAVVVYTGWGPRDEDRKLPPPTAVERFLRAVADGPGAERKPDGS